MKRFKIGEIYTFDYNPPAPTYKYKVEDRSICIKFNESKINELKEKLIKTYNNDIITTILKDDEVKTFLKLSYEYENAKNIKNKEKYIIKSQIDKLKEQLHKKYDYIFNYSNSKSNELMEYSLFIRNYNPEFIVSGHRITAMYGGERLTKNFKIIHRWYILSPTYISKDTYEKYNISDIVILIKNYNESTSYTYNL